MSAVRKGYGSYIGMVLGAAGALLLQLPAKYHSTSANCTGGACRQQQDCHSERHGERLAGRISSGGRSQKTKDANNTPCRSYHSLLFCLRNTRIGARCA